MKIVRLRSKNSVLCLSALIVGFSMLGCSEKSAEKPQASTAVAAKKQQPQTAIDRLVQWSETDLRQHARKAVLEHRWYKPSGNSAIEYYMALRIKLQNRDEGVESALTDILPYAIIGMDQAIARFDDTEALRLEALIRQIDAHAPALARVATDLQKMKARQAQQMLASAKLEAELKTKALADANLAKSAVIKAEKDAVTAKAVLAQAPPPPVVAVAPVVVQEAPKPAPVAKATVVALKTPQPQYPREALAAGIKGEVVAEISISGNGDVTSVRIVSAAPRNVFDKAVQSAVRRWQYQGNGEPTTIRRTFAFN